MSLASALGAITAAAEVLVEPIMVEATRANLQDVLDAFDEDHFRHEAPIASYSFGTAFSGTQLSHHHSLAQQIIADTLDGITEDIAAFAANVTKSAQILLDIDGTSAADLKKRTAILEQFDYLQQHSHGESNNQQTRNDLENGGA
jgi:alcohol dehydrogenase class IV